MQEKLKSRKKNLIHRSSGPSRIYQHNTNNWIKLSTRPEAYLKNHQTTLKSISTYTPYEKLQKTQTQLSTLKIQNNSYLNKNTTQNKTKLTKQPNIN